MYKDLKTCKFGKNSDCTAHGIEHEQIHVVDQVIHSHSSNSRISGGGGGSFSTPKEGGERTKKNTTESVELERDGDLRTDPYIEVKEEDEVIYLDSEYRNDIQMSAIILTALALAVVVINYVIWQK